MQSARPGKAAFAAFAKFRPPKLKRWATADLHVSGDTRRSKWIEMEMRPLRLFNAVTGVEHNTDKTKIQVGFFKSYMTWEGFILWASLGSVSYICSVSCCVRQRRDKHDPPAARQRERNFLRRRYRRGLMVWMQQLIIRD